MTAETLLGLAVFAAATLFTPGPNNIMLMTSGVNFGLARSAPHILGVTLGFALMIGLVAVGLGGLIAARPQIHGAMKIAAALYMLWLAWRIAHSAGGEAASAAARPLGFLGAAAFQWVNPKGWSMALAATALYVLPQAYAASVAAIVLTFCVLGLASSIAWTAFGAALRNLLGDPGRRRVFNWAMAGLVVASILPMLA